MRVANGEHPIVVYDDESSWRSLFNLHTIEGCGISYWVYFHSEFLRMKKNIYLFVIYTGKWDETHIDPYEL